MALPNFISGIFGVTEPAIYGILLPLKKPFVISCIAGGIGGGFYGAFNFRKFMMGGIGIFEFPAMIEPDGGLGNLVVAVLGVVITMAIAFAATMIFYKEPETQDISGKGIPENDSMKGGKEAGSKDGEAAAQGTDTAPIMRKVEIASPLKGKVLKTIKSGAFKKTSAKLVVSAKKMSKKQKVKLLKNLKKAGAGKKTKVK